MSVLPDISNIVSPGNVPKVKSKVLARLLPSIEFALEAGYTHEQIHEWISNHGLKLDRKYYHDAIYRLRKRRTSHQDASMATQSAPADAVHRPDAGKDSEALAKTSSLAHAVKGLNLSAGIDATTGKAAGTISENSGLAKFRPANARNFDTTNI